MAITIASIGNTLGAITWAIGFYGGVWFINNLLRTSCPEHQRAEQWYTCWGSWSLLLVWIPFLGDALCLVGGILKIPLLRFTILVATGKAVRYIFVGWALLKLVS